MITSPSPPSTAPPQSVSSKRVAFQTLGCKLNQYETDSLATQFKNAGYELVQFDEQADAYIINTCTVTTKADRKSRNSINRAVRLTAMTPSQTIVVVTGCYAESHRQELLDEGITHVVSNDQKSSIFNIVDAYLNDEILSSGRIYTQAKKSLFAYHPAAPIYHTRSMVKIQDGCDNFCTFCIIPYVRGRAVSRPVPEILDDVRANLDMGYREIVITGVNLSRYMHEEINFSELMMKIAELPGDFRLRISSLEPDSLDDRFFELLTHPRMCPHLHLCLQSGSERILLAMRRQYTARGYRTIAEKIRTMIPDFNLTTDVIVGFPGETEAEFNETCDLVREIAFSHVHTFNYSRRSGTRADRLKEHLPAKVRHRRSEIMRDISSKNRIEYHTSMIGKTQHLLVETTSAQHAETKFAGRGYGQHYVPIVVHNRVQNNTIYQVQLKSVETNGKESVLAGEII